MVLRHEGAYRCRCPVGPHAYLIGTAAHVSDVTQAQALLHGDETQAFGDAGYQGVEKRDSNLECPVTWHIALRPGKRKALKNTPQGNLVEWMELTKVSGPSSNILSML